VEEEKSALGQDLRLAVIPDGLFRQQTFVASIPSRLPSFSIFDAICPTPTAQWWADPQQFHKDFLAAIQDARGGTVNSGTAFRSFPPGSTVDTTG
jgi:hypothetical protein